MCVFIALFFNAASSVAILRFSFVESFTMIEEVPILTVQPKQFTVPGAVM